ncbi:probable disease resistance protein At5g63020 [Hevea brasiliensis]|uniref:probable disease resistance protein At5g63020 n=1 Tax=Hevea brasiliensis TaxID=3981 RepID=UPI0025EBBDDC|nr:probable disease resistance protein At5g63020 [Hevea brasiliensis]
MSSSMEFKVMNMLMLQRCPSHIMANIRGLLTCVKFLIRNDFSIQCGDALIGRCWDCVAGQALYVCQLEDNLQELETARDKLRELSNDVMRRVNSEETPQTVQLDRVGGWLSRVDATITEFDSLLNRATRERQKLCLAGCCSKNCKSTYMFGKSVSRSLKHVVGLMSEGDFKEVVERTLPEPVVVGNVNPTLGTETTLDEAWSYITGDEVRIVGIYGMGGVGKTTLLTKINNRFATISNNFDVVISAVVSKDLKPEKIQEQIWKRIGFLDKKWKKKSLREKAEDIFYVLSRKKFVLLLDDIWRRVDLEEIGVPLPTRQNRCKIVFTTRSCRVGGQMEAEKMIKVEPLAWEEAWALFQKKVGDIDFDIVPLSQDVAKECSGLPIALITIGRAMASKITKEEWEHALEVLRSPASSLLGMEDEVIPDMEVEVFVRLKFSYDGLLSDKVKFCFLYCSLFPEEFEIEKDDLVHYWIYENFCARNEAYSIIGTLVGACLLEEKGQHVKMHDVIRDMALLIACKYEKEKHKFFVEAGAQLTRVPEVGKWEVSKRMSLMANSFERIQEIPRCPDLLTLFLSDNRNLSGISDGFFQFMGTLTILDLSSTNIKKLPVGISKLNSLQYLNLSWTLISQLPIELKMLVKLKYLNLVGNFELNMIPRGVISSLSSLQVLKMYNVGFLWVEELEDNILREKNKLIEELQCLEHLNELSSTIRSVSDLQSYVNTHTLVNCTRALWLNLFPSKQSLNIWWLANMKNLEDMVIIGGRNSEELGINVVMEEIEAHDAGGGLGNSMISRKTYFNSLHTLTLGGSLRLRDMTWVILAPNLMCLNVQVNEHIEEIISVEKLDDVQVGDENFNPFFKLQVLRLHVLPQLKSIYPNALSFPSLEKIEVNECPQLKKLPLNSSSANGGKVEIRAEEQWWKDVEWEDDSTKTTFLPCFVHARYHWG